MPGQGGVPPARYGFPGGKSWLFLALECSEE